MSSVATMQTAAATDMDKVVKRLRTTKDFAPCRRLGRKWAEERADYYTLKRLAEAREKATGDDTNWLCGSGSQDCPDAKERLLNILCPGQELSVSERAVFLPDWGTESIKPEQISVAMHGFACGALDVWQVVKDKI